MTATTGTSAWVIELIEALWAGPGNDMHRGEPERAWDPPLIGFANGADALWEQYKTVVDPSHWTPMEAWRLAYPDVDGAPEDLTVISWILPQTEATKRDQREQTLYLAERWARTRVYGEQANHQLRCDVAQALTDAGYPAVAPVASPQWGIRDSETVRLHLQLVRAPRSIRCGTGHFRAVRRPHHPGRESHARGVGGRQNPNPRLAAPLHRPSRLLSLLCQGHLRRMHRPLSCGRDLHGWARQTRVRSPSGPDPPLCHGNLRLRRLRLRPLPGRRPLRVAHPRRDRALRRKPLRDRRAPVLAEGPCGDTDPRRRLPPLVLSAVHHPHNP